MWNLYLVARCQNSWLREIKTHRVQCWLEDIAREYTLSKTTLAHIKNLLSGIFRHAAQQGYFDGANPVKLAEIPAFAPNAAEGHAYSLEEIGRMLRLLPLRASAAIATAAYTGLRLGELHGLTWDAYLPPENSDELGLIHVRRSLWRGNIGQPKTEKSKAAVPVVPQLAEKLAEFRSSIGNPNNKCENIGSLTNAVSNDPSVTINRIHDVTIVSTRDRNTGEVSTETFFGDSPYGK